MSSLRLEICGFALACLVLAAMGHGQIAPPSLHGSTTTAQHLEAAPWWPTKPFASREAYAGTAACADCHDEIVQSQKDSQMARTLTPASDSSVLRRHPKLTYQSGPFTTSVQHRAADFGIAVADGTQTRDAVLQWAFGSGDIGQSYVWKAENGFREARFNFFSSLDGLAATPGRLQGAPTTLDMAVGRPLEEFEARTCFGCHTSALSSATPLDLHSMIAGVTCEGCHGPGAEHIAAVMQSSGAPEKHWDRHIVNAGRMTPEEQVDFCGACHSTPWDVRAMGAVGLPTVRFPAYRLEKSRCWGAAGNKRVTCTACHDPHQPLAREASAYDHACLACHATSPHAKTTAERPGAACSVATSKCTSCHMPKYELPEMHARFTDHMIRIARAGEALPD